MTTYNPDERPEQPDETPQEPDEETLPAKPPIEDMPDEDRDVGPGEPVPDSDYLTPEQARDDDTVDDDEIDDAPVSDGPQPPLPEP